MVPIYCRDNMGVMFYVQVHIIYSLINIEIVMIHNTSMRGMPNVRVSLRNVDFLFLVPNILTSIFGVLASTFAILTPVFEIFTSLVATQLLTSIFDILTSIFTGANIDVNISNIDVNISNIDGRIYKCKYWRQ